MATDPAPACPECGAPAVDGFGCWEQLGLLLGWEGDDPQLQAVHYLTVATYNLQHPAQFTPAALAGLRAGFVDHLDHGVDVAELRRRAAHASAGATRVLAPARRAAPRPAPLEPDHRRRLHARPARRRRLARPGLGRGRAPGDGQPATLADGGPGRRPPPRRTSVTVAQQQPQVHPAPGLTRSWADRRRSNPGGRYRTRRSRRASSYRLRSYPHPKVLGVSRRRSAGIPPAQPDPLPGRRPPVVGQAKEATHAGRGHLRTSFPSQSNDSNPLAPWRPGRRWRPGGAGNAGYAGG